MSQPEDFKLHTPDSVAADPQAVEFTRMWWSRGEPVMSIKPAFKDPAEYGRMLAIAARHMAHGYSVRHGQDEREAYHRILQGMSDVIKADNAQTVVEDTKPGSVQ